MTQNFCWIGMGKLTKFFTRCMNLMLFKMFNWYIFKIFYSLKISLVCSKLFLLKIIRILAFVNCYFFQGLSCRYCPRLYWNSLSRFVYMSSKELVGYLFLKKVWPYKVVLNFFPILFSVYLMYSF